MDRSRLSGPGARRAAALALAVVALLGSGCVSKKAFVAKTQELDAAARALASERQRVAELEASLASARGEVARLTGQLQEATDQRETLARQLALVQESASRKDVNLRELNARYDTLVKDLERQKGELSGRITTLSGELAEATSRVEALTGERDRLVAEIGGLRTALADLQSALGDTQAALAERDRKLRETTATYDRLVADLKGEIAEGQVKITQLQDRLTVNLVDKILFDSGSTVIKPRGREVLLKVAEVLRPITDKRIQIEGHTDNVPIAAAYRERFPSNWELATARATVVARFLQDQGKIEPVRLAATGYGEYHPVASNDTPEGRAQNRRIEIVLVPLAMEAAAR